MLVYQRVDGFQPVGLQKIGVSPAPKVFPMVLSGSHGEAMQAEQEPKILVQQDLMAVRARETTCQRLDLELSQNGRFITENPMNMDDLGISMDWFKGKSTGNHRFSHLLLFFFLYINVPLNQSIESMNYGVGRTYLSIHQFIHLLPTVHTSVYVSVSPI